MYFIKCTRMTNTEFCKCTNINSMHEVFSLIVFHSPVVPVVKPLVMVETTLEVADFSHPG